MTLPRKGLCGKRERKEDEVFVSKGRGSGGRKEEEKLKRETREDDSANAESAVLPNKLRHVTSQGRQDGGVTAHAHKYYQKWRPTRRSVKILPHIPTHWSLSRIGVTGLERILLVSLRDGRLE